MGNQEPSLGHSGEPGILLLAYSETPYTCDCFSPIHRDWKIPGTKLNHT